MDMMFKFQIAGGSAFFQGGVTFLDTDNEISGIFTDNNSNDFLNIHLPVHYDVTFTGSSATLYLVSGHVTSAAIPTFHTAAD